MDFHLHEYEKRILLALEHKPEQSFEELMSGTGLEQASINRASAWLFSKGLVDILEDSEERVELDTEGRDYAKHGLPERRVLEKVSRSEQSIGSLNKELGAEKARIGLTWLSKLRLVNIDAGVVRIADSGHRFLSEKFPQEKVLDYVSKGKTPPQKLSNEYVVLKKRGRVLKTKEIKRRRVKLKSPGRELIKKGISTEKEVSQLTPKLILGGKWRDVKFREYDIDAPVPRVYQGKRHFVNQAMDYVRKVWLEMGFREMTGPLIQTSFWNFDALFVPQEHPAREMQDTFFMKPDKGRLPTGTLSKKVQGVHELGVKDSLGWSYKWDEGIAKKLVLRTHTTVLSARTLAALKHDELPAKYFAVGRCFRNEALDWKHLFEFNQVEGIVVDEDANFRHLLGYLKGFFKKLGFEKPRFRPSYFPYTEPSVEIEIKHPTRKEWVELGGAGVFRPEVVEPLLGKDIPVLAWGPGFDRIIMDYYKIKDIRGLYKNDVQQLRDMKQWMVG